MDVDKILVQLAGVAGKRKGDLKRIYNNLVKKKDEEGITKKLLGDNFERIIFLGVCNKYDIPIEKLDAYLDEEKSFDEAVEKATDEPEEEEEEEEDDDEIDWDEDDWDEDDDDEDEDDDDDEIDWDEDDEEDDDNGFDEFDDENHGESDGSWQSIFKTTPKPKSGEDLDYERLESLEQVAGIKYYLKLANPEEKPYIHEGIGKRDNKAFTSYALDVILVKLSPKRRYDNRYKKGDNRGKKMFVNKKKYKLWLSQTAWNWFVAFWVDDLGISAPDGRIFSYEKVKLEKVTEYYFAVPKRKK